MNTERIIEFGVITAPRKVEVHRRPLPEIGENEILVKLKACNICTSDYGQWSGARSNQPFPIAGGHENAGIIEEKGSHVRDNLNEGDQVAFTYFHCGVCEACRRGNTFGCQYEERFKKSEDGYYGDFGFATYKIADARLAVKIKPDIPAAEASFMEPVATVVQGMKRLKIKPLDTLVVIGAGTMGLINAQVARVFGARVIVTEMMEKKLELAKQLGFPHVIDISKTDPVNAVKDLTGGKGADIAILAVGASSANQQALDMVKATGAKISLFAAGYPDPELKISTNAIHYRKIELIGTFGANAVDFQEAADIINSKAIDVRSLLEGSFPLSEIEKAYELASTPGSYRVTVTL
jgi:L-iditol 2-dehydrogenase